MSPALNITTPIANNGSAHTNGVTPIRGIKKHIDGFGTRAVHVGSDANEDTGAVIPPISLSTTYKQNSIGVHKVCDFFFFLLFFSLTDDGGGGYYYYRVSNTLVQEILIEMLLKRLWLRLNLAVLMPWLLRQGQPRLLRCCNRLDPTLISSPSTMYMGVLLGIFVGWLRKIKD